jgi:hypothetical protein
LTDHLPGKAPATRQVVATGAWKQDGAHRDVASWLSATTGSTLGFGAGDIGDGRPGRMPFVSPNEWVPRW